MSSGHHETAHDGNEDDDCSDDDDHDLEPALRDLAAIFLEEIPNGQNGLGVNLADARFGDAEGLGDFAKTHIFEIIKGENFALHFRKLLNALGDHTCEFFLRDIPTSSAIRPQWNYCVARFGQSSMAR